MKVVTRNEGPLCIIAPEGAFVEEELEELRRPISKCLEEGRKEILLDMTRISHFDSKGLESLEGWSLEFNRARGWLAVANPNQLCRDILRATRIDHIVEVFDSMEDALRGTR